MIITLTTDFGWRDPYVGMLKGVFLSRLGSDVKIIDVTHGIREFSIKDGAFVVYKTYSYFPRGSFHLAVVDPGVGGKRGIIALSTRDGHTFVGPNNGIFSYFFHNNLVENLSIYNPDGLAYKTTGRTFQARDIMAHLLADIAIGKRDIGDELWEEPFIFEKPVKKISSKGITFEIVYIDSFGNCITNLLKSDIEGRGFLINVGNKTIRRLLNSFEEGEEDEVFLVEGGFGLIEIAMKERSASSVLSINTGDKLELLWLS